MKLPKKEVIDDTSPSVDTTNRHEDDQFLRDHGFELVERPKGQQSLWKQKGYKAKERLWTFSEAMRMLQEVEKERRKLRGGL